MVGTPKTVVTFGGASSGGFSNPTGGYAQLFQRLIGYTPRYPFLGGAGLLGARRRSRT